MKTRNGFWICSALLLAGCATEAHHVLSFGSDQPQPDMALVDPQKIEAPLSERRRWVIEQKERNRRRFDSEYGWILKSPTIGKQEAQQIAYLFFYSSGSSCGYLDRPVLSGRFWSCALHIGFYPEDVKPILVESGSGFVWQDGQSEKVDALSLIKTEAEEKPNQ